jgi:hypothetical protein
MSDAAFDPDKDRPLPGLALASARTPQFLSKPESATIVAE